jgi:hypothetical protein
MSAVQNAERVPQARPLVAGTAAENMPVYGSDRIQIVMRNRKPNWFGKRGGIRAAVTDAEIFGN